MDDIENKYFTPREKQKVNCPECGDSLKPFLFKRTIAYNLGIDENRAVFWGCDNACEYVELRYHENFSEIKDTNWMEKHIDKEG